jgi:tRNA pseudouridine55 synthase
MEGFLLIDKPPGITSHDVIDRLRRTTGVRRIGHAGTLDPFATGLLLVGVGGSATTRLSEFAGMDKEYEGTAVLGAASDTQDGTGTIAARPGAEMPTEAALRSAMDGFIGRISQVPPMFSAKKVAGKKLYELARQGKEVRREPVEIVVRSLELLGYEPPRFSFRVRCSSGTYVRTLAHDIGAALGAGAYLESLRRTAIGPYRVEDAAALADLTPDDWPTRLFSPSSK